MTIIFQNETLITYTGGGRSKISLTRVYGVILTLSGLRSDVGTQVGFVSSRPTSEPSFAVISPAKPVHFKFILAFEVLTRERAIRATFVP